MSLNSIAMFATDSAPFTQVDIGEGTKWPVVIKFNEDATLFLSYSTALRLAKVLRIAAGAEEEALQVEALGEA